jgi:hypothetical protein
MEQYNKLYQQFKYGVDSDILTKPVMHKIEEEAGERGTKIIKKTLGYGVIQERNIIRDKKNPDIIENQIIEPPTKYEFTNREYSIPPSFMLNKVDQGVKDTLLLRDKVVSANNVRLGQELEMLDTIQNNDYLKSLPLTQRLVEFDRLVKLGYKGMRAPNQRIRAVQDGIRSHVSTRDRFTESELRRPIRRQ